LITVGVIENTQRFQLPHAPIILNTNTGMCLMRGAGPRFRVRLWWDGCRFPIGYSTVFRHR